MSFSGSQISVWIDCDKYDKKIKPKIDIISILMGLTLHDYNSYQCGN